MEAKKSNRKITSMKKNFSDSYMLLRAVDQDDVREKIKKLCKWRNDGDFSAKKNGKRNIKISHWEIVKSVFANYGIDAEENCLLEEV